VIELPTPSRWRPPAHPSSGGLRRPERRASNFHAAAAEGQPTSGSYFADLLRNGMRRIAEASWRRRYLLLTPVLAMLPLSLIAALVLPRSYESSALLLLQESSRNNPFASDPVSPEFMQQKVPGLEALLKSEQVLAPAIRSIQTAGLRKPENDLPAAIRSLRRSLSVELIGTDFLAIRLSGPKSQGLGQQLSIVLSSFLEALLSGPRANAAEIVLEKQQQQILLLEQEKAAVQQELAKAARSGADVEAHTNNQGGSVDLNRQLLQLEQQLISARQTYDSLAKRYPQANAGAGPGILNAPGRIKIVDPPQDPTISTTSRLKMLLAGIAAGLLLGVALAWAAELLDPIIYERDELISATGLPLLAVLGRTPQISGSAPPVAMGSRPRSRARPILFTIAAIVLLGLIYVLAFGPPSQFQIPNWLSSIDSTQQTTPVVEP
jgi:uncharacterized protein involved in exopolysaccharide biosynthesis